MYNGPVFHKDLLRNYQVIDRAGTFIVSVAADVTEDNLWLEDEYPRYLVPLRVIKAENLMELVGILNEFGTVPFAAVRNFFLTGAIFVNDGIDNIDLPAKGERIVATFEEKDGELLCTNIKLIDRDDLMYVNMEAIDDLYQMASKFITKDD